MLRQRQDRVAQGYKECYYHKTKTEKENCGNRNKQCTQHIIKMVRFHCLKINDMNNKRNKGRGKDTLQGLNLHPWNQDTRCHDYRFI